MAKPGLQSALFDSIQGLQRLADLFEQRRRQLARGAGLSDEQWRVLDGIARENFMPSLFARRCDRHPAAVSRTLRELLERGLVAVSISRDDARQREYELSLRGRRLLKGLRERREHAIEAVWKGFDRRQLMEFARFSTQLADRLEAYSRDELADP